MPKVLDRHAHGRANQRGEDRGALRFTGVDREPGFDIGSWIDALRNLEMFAGCTPTELVQIDRLGTRVHVAAGRELTREGGGAGECFVVCDGYAVALRDGDALGSIGPGSIVGEIALLGHTTRNATVLAATPMELLVLTYRELRELLEIAPCVAARVEQLAAERSRPQSVLKS